MSDSTPDTVVMVSYMPLLYADKFVNLQPEDLEKIIPEETPIAKGCAWLLKNDVPSVVLLADDAKAIVDHMRWWSEGDFAKMFQVLVADNGVRYTVSVVPNVDASAERWRRNYKTLTGVDLGADVKCSMFFQPFSFVSGAQKTYLAIKDKVMSLLSLEVSMINTSDYNGNESDSSKILRVGRLDFARGEFWRMYSNKMLSEDGSDAVV